MHSLSSMFLLDWSVSMDALLHPLLLSRISRLLRRAHSDISTLKRSSPFIIRRLPGRFSSPTLRRVTCQVVSSKLPQLHSHPAIQQFNRWDPKPKLERAAANGHWMSVVLCNSAEDQLNRNTCSRSIFATIERSKGHA